MITHVREHAARGPSYASGGEPGWTEVRWECDGNCGFSGEWDDHPHMANGWPINEPREGLESYCEACAEALQDEAEDEHTNP